MNTLRWFATTVAATALSVLAAVPAAAVFGASPVRAGESSQSTIEVFTSAAPTFSAAPPAGLSVSFTAPQEVEPTRWTTAMTISAALETAAGAYSFPLTVSGPNGVLLSDTVSVTVQPATGTTTSTTTTTPPPATTTTTTAATTTTSTTSTSTTTSSSTTSTTAPATTTTPTTTVPPTTVPPTTVPPTTVLPTPPTTVLPTTVPPATQTPPSTDLAAAIPDGPPGAALDTANSPPLGVVLAVGAVALGVLGWFAIAGARRRRFTPAREGMFREP